MGQGLVIKPFFTVEKLRIELHSYENSAWWSTDKELLNQHGPLLFYKENEKVKNPQFDYIISLN